jgi:hypothetical protein
MAKPPKDYAKIVAKAWSDPAFHQALLANPRKALTAEGWNIPDSVGVQVKDGDSCSFVLGIPPKPAGLSDEQLREAAHKHHPCCTDAEVACC